MWEVAVALGASWNSGPVAFWMGAGCAAQPTGAVCGKARIGGAPAVAAVADAVAGQSGICRKIAARIHTQLRAQ